MYRVVDLRSRAASKIAYYLGPQGMPTACMLWGHRWSRDEFEIGEAHYHRCLRKGCDWQYQCPTGSVVFAALPSARVVRDDR